jgi:hypothetical protein
MNYLMPAAKQALLEGRVDYRSDPIFCVLIDAGTYTFSLAHASLADVPAWARVSTSGTLANRTTTNGIADADDITFPAVASSRTVEAVALFSGTDDSALYLAYMDQAAGLPITPTGEPITVVWDNGTRKVFSL